MPCFRFSRAGMLRILQSDPALAAPTWSRDLQGFGGSCVSATRLPICFSGAIWRCSILTRTEKKATSPSLLSAGLSEKSGPEARSSGSEMDVDRDHIAEVSALFPIASGAKFSYGTAGFRADASELMSTVFRCGILAALRSLSTKRVTGLMITASHNPLPDNGVKLTDPGGNMLVMEWEGYANALANAVDSEALVKIVDEIVKNEGIASGCSLFGRVLIARDTRPSGQALIAAAIQGVEAVTGCVVDNMGVLSTPQLHWMVRSVNQGLRYSEADYFALLAQAFRKLIDIEAQTIPRAFPRGLIVDGANGVGALKLQSLQNILGLLALEVRNSGREGEGNLNDGVGADFVQKEKKAPKGFGDSKDLGRRCVSLDGDADRLIYFYLGCSPNGDAIMHLLDGDKILTLFASFIKDQIQTLSIGNSSDACSFILPKFGIVTLGIVQTAYANGASTRYLKDSIGVEVVLAKTGVKHLHEKAAQYDVGIYFEANGHGTILFGSKFLDWLQVNAAIEDEVDKQLAIQNLLATCQVVNQAVGDALSGVLLVEAILSKWNWSIVDWNEVYSDLPSRQTKVKVANRASITTTDAETRVSCPSELQDAIDAEVAKYAEGRAFVRSSGTEDIVRVYAEAAKQEDADLLAQGVALLVYRLAGGVGPEP